MAKVQVTGKHALVTGASTGIGRAVAVTLAQAGVPLLGVHYANNETEAKETVRLVEQAGSRAILLKADIADEARADELVARFVSQVGGLDILINNAGTLVQRHSIEGLPTDVWRRVFGVNVDGLFFVTRAAIPHLKKNGGSIVNIASVAAYTGGGPGSVHYAATKGAVVTLTLGLAKELAPFGVRVNAVAPGPIDTPFHDRFSTEEQRKMFADATLTKRMGTAEEVADVVVFLVSERASYIVGSTIDVNGGMYLRP